MRRISELLPEAPGLGVLIVFGLVVSALGMTGVWIATSRPDLAHFITDRGAFWPLVIYGAFWVVKRLHS